MGLAGKGVLVTGATSGIGAQCARAFARQGANLVLTGRNAELGQALAKELAGCDATFVRSELGTATAADALIAESIGALGSLDVLVNSAGVIHHRNAPETSDEQWEETIAVNLSAVFYLSRAAVRTMVPAGGGVIVNIASTWGIVAGERVAAYCASKGAVIALTRAMAVDHARENVRVNAVCPGAVDTPMLVNEAEQVGMNPDEGRRLWAADAPNRRLASAQEIADAVVFLAANLAHVLAETALHRLHVLANNLHVAPQANLHRVQGREHSAPESDNRHRKCQHRNPFRRPAAAGTLRCRPPPAFHRRRGVDMRVKVPMQFGAGRATPPAPPPLALRYMGSHARQMPSLAAIHSRTTSSTSRPSTSTA